MVSCYSSDRRTSSRTKRCSCRWRSRAPLTALLLRRLALGLAQSRRTVAMEQKQKDNKHEPAVPSTEDVSEPPAPAAEEVPAAEAGTTSFREIFRNALNTARREHKPLASRKELSRDKSKSL